MDETAPSAPPPPLRAARRRPRVNTCVSQQTRADLAGDTPVGESEGRTIDRWNEQRRGNFTGLRHAVGNAMGSAPFELLEVAESLLRIRARSRDPAVHADVDGAARRVQVVSGEIAAARRLLADPPRPAKEA